MVLAMTHEEVVGLLLADIIKSYRQLPVQVYHFQTKWRDEPRARGGLIRVREFVMKDAYSCDRDDEGLEASYWAQHGAYVRIFERLGLETIAVSSDVGMMGGSQAHEFMVLNPAGEDVLVLCEACGYAANRQVAVVPKSDPEPEDALPREEVETPGTTTIATLTALLGIGPERTAKAAFFVAGDGRLITAIVRGDYEVNETKLVNATKATGGLRPATLEEIKAAGMEPGYGSPIGAHDTVVVVDDLVSRSANLVAGANREGVHYRNVNVGRDFTPDVVADITNAQEGDPCPQCGMAVVLRNGIEVGNIFKLGSKYSDAAGATYLGEDGREHPIIMGSYGIGVGRNVACIVEANHDDKGIIWPAEVAPYAAHLVAIGAARDPQVGELADRLHDLSIEAGREILYDDRDESPGVKFTDAELLGMPWILTVSPRSLAAGGVEVTERATGERSTRPIADVEALLRDEGGEAIVPA
jgi:prolyl-tRNA synthetase